MTHPSHDWSALSWKCFACGVGISSVDADLPCKPNAAEPGSLPCDVERAEVDYAAITRAVSGA